MPAKPAWVHEIDHAIRSLEALPRPFVDRATIEFLLRVAAAGLSRSHAVRNRVA